jgi:2-dehydro-3-deoxyphosphogluconate aldolase / (4S)-4-hydroxy-2-oxoglutarate aldolase
VTVIEDLGGARVVPVVVLENSHYASVLADALLTGGLPCVEVTLRTPASLDVLSEMASRPGLVVGAGTVLTPQQVDLAVDAGAQFIVSPGLDRDVVERALALGVTPLPGVATATEVQAARRLGLRHLKFFPAEAAGGIDVIAALHGPFADVQFMPTGGITLDTLGAYLGHRAVFAVGGSWMVPRSALDAGDMNTVQRLTRDTADLLGRFS